jgi:hypothetical protein
MALKKGRKSWKKRFHVHLLHRLGRPMIQLVLDFQRFPSLPLDADSPILLLAPLLLLLLLLLTLALRRHPVSV